MAEVVYKAVLDNPTPLPPGGQVDSSVIDVNGARTVHLLLYIPGPDPAVYWNLNFGPALPNEYAVVQTNSGTFQDDNIVAIAVPVFGPSLMLQFQNQGAQDETVNALIYFIRDVP